ncbi:MAG: cell division ATP-binding protein FtsE [Alphaproteobacteria bacterium]|nr:cell division ATP-binding protein FtsE [Alphaproteobacteria bacterium]
MQKTQSDSSKPIISLQNVGLRYNAGPEVLKDINLEIHAGEFYFLTGASGAGKTSLLKLLHLAHKPTRGKIKIFGKDIDFIKQQDMALIRRRIGIVFQDYHLLDHLSVLDNVALPLRIVGRSERYIQEQVPELIEWVGLKKFINTKPKLLSGGQQQRVAIARAVINNPSILIADEPTGNVDEEMAKKLLFLFLKLNKMGTTVIIATHSTNLIKQFHFPVLHLQDGMLTKE